MFSSIQRLIGVITVHEKGDLIHIDGLPAGRLMTDIRKIWSTSKIEQFMFTKMRGSSIAFHRFFALDFEYALHTLLEKGHRSNRRAVKQILAELRENTWLKRLNEDHPDIVNWDRLDELNITLLPTQRQFIETYNKIVPKYLLKGYLLGAAPGTGKAQPLTANIKVPGGWAKMGDMQIGTEVITPKGTITEVTGVYPQGEVDIYRITFADGRETECCGDHLWKVYSKHEEKTGYWKIKSTKEIMASTSFSAGRVYVPLIEAEDGPEQDLLVDPYVLGVVLGDGNISAESAIVISNPDDFIKDKLAARLGDDVKIGGLNADIEFNIIGANNEPGRSRRNSLLEKLRTMKLMGTYSHTKHIPREYLLGSKQQRLDLLNGLMDTDGTADKSGSASYISTSLDLAEAVQYLVRSLGGIADITPKTKQFTYKGEKKYGRPAYQVNIRHSKPSELFTLPRKKERMNDDNQYAGTLKLRIESIEYVGKKLAQCISVADEEHLYVTDRFIVTHNTIAGLSLATVLEADVIFCVVPKNAVNKVWEDTITSIYKKPVSYWLSNDGTVPELGRKVYVVHYEALEKIVQFVRNNRGHWKKPVVLLDESHNLNEIGSARTQNFITLCKMLDAKHVVWASGTPLKAAGTEVAPLMHTIDSFFDEDAEKRFMGVFGKNASRALDILANRMGLVTFKVDKAQAVGNKVNDYPIKVKIPNGDDYTLDSIREVMRKFIEERMRYYRENMRHYVDIYENCLAIYEKSIAHNRDAQEKFKLYKSYISMIRRGYDPVTMKEMALYCNQFELGQIVQSLPQQLKADFKDCRSVVKYYDLKVQGEALGRILGKMRAQCHVDMLPHAPIAELVEESEKKTVIFTSYVEVVKAAEIQLKKEGFKPILVFGETNKDLPAIVTKFRDDIDTNPLVATYKSLSTAVPLVMANTVILLNAPFRDYERQQATSRVDRLGQDCEVNIITIMLDTGEKPNISTRSGDILDWSREQVEQIMGVKAIELGVECYANLLDNDEMQQAVDHPSWLKW